MLNQLNIIAQKVQRAAVRTSLKSTLSHEPEEFELKFARLCATLKTLRKTEQAIKRYIKKSHSLAKSAHEVGAVIGTPAESLAALSSQCKSKMDDDILIQALEAKIKLLETTVKERHRLEDIRLVRDHNAQRLHQVMARRSKAKQGDADDAKMANEEAKWLAKREQMDAEYAELLAELTKALDFIDEETARDGPWALVQAELSAFRGNSKKMLDDMQQMFAGLHPGSFVPNREEALEALRAENDSFRSRPEPPAPPPEDD